MLICGCTMSLNTTNVCIFENCFTHISPTFSLTCLMSWKFSLFKIKLSGLCLASQHEDPLLILTELKRIALISFTIPTLVYTLVCLKDFAVLWLHLPAVSYLDSVCITADNMRMRFRRGAAVHCCLQWLTSPLSTH